MILAEIYPLKELQMDDPNVANDHSQSSVI